jgi:hypothetical protein
MPWVGFEPTMPAFERAKTVHALGRAANEIGSLQVYRIKFATYFALFAHSTRPTITMFLHLTTLKYLLKDTYCGVPRTSIAKQRLQLELVSVFAEKNTLTTATPETRT